MGVWRWQKVENVVGQPGQVQMRVVQVRKKKGLEGCVWERVLLMLSAHILAKSPGHLYISYTVLRVYLKNELFEKWINNWRNYRCLKSS